MAISHELSTEIATALLTGKTRTPGELADLKKMLLEIHSTLEELNQKRAESETSGSDQTKAAGSGA